MFTQELLQGMLENYDFPVNRCDVFTCPHTTLTLGEMSNDFDSKVNAILNVVNEQI